MTPPNVVASDQIRYETAYFFDVLFGQRAGELCLGYIAGDPQIEPMRSEWYSWPRQRAEVLARLTWHATQGHNTYVRQVLFKKRSGTKANALPSPWIWRDDVQETRAAYTLLVETSAGNYQAFIQLDRDASTDERRRLMTAWRNAHTDSDTCSADPVHFVRVPGGHNRKRHGCWPVRLTGQTGRIYNADALLTKCTSRPARGGETHTHPEGRALALDQKALDHWLTHVEQLLNTDKTLPRAFVRDTPGRRILELRAAGKGMLFHASGSWDASRERLWLANSLVLARYTNEQTAALIWHFEVTETIEIKGKDAIWADIGRVIGMARQAHPTITPRIYGAQPKKAKRGRAGSHADLVEQVYALLIDQRAGDKAIVKTGDLAASVGCHRRTIITILDELERAGRIGERKQLGQHGGLVISGVIYSAPAEAAAPQPGAPNEAPPAATPGETGSPGVCVSPESREVDHSCPSLAAAVAEAFDVYADRPLLPRKKGKARRAPLTRHKIARYIDGSYPRLHFTDRALDRAIERERRNRKLAHLAELTPAGLRAEIRLADHLAEQSRLRVEEPGSVYDGADRGQCSAPLDSSYRWWEFYRDAARRELASRPPDAKRPKGWQTDLPKRPKGGYTPCEAIPNPREVAAQVQAEMWGVVEADAARRPLPERPGRAVKVEPEPPVPAERYNPAPGAGLIAALSKRQAAQSA